MRLLHTETYTFNEYLDPETTQYAILSHRWNTSGSEVLYHELKDIASHPELLASSRFDKVKMACATARHQTPPLEWIWIDSCCIDKTNNVELAEALNSMYTWYRQAALCLAYLFDVNLYAGTNAGEPTLRTADASRYSEWFSRGWTLQELLAPRQMMFYDRHWTPIGTKEGLASELRIATGDIHEDFLTGASDVRTASAAMKLSWACGRTTTKREDRVYSLLGLLDVQLSPFYGEGERKAFWRLQQEFFKQSRDESIFAWTLPPRKDAADNPVPPGWREDEWGLIAPSIECFRDSGDVTTTVGEGRQIAEREFGGYYATNQGIVFPVPDGGLALLVGRRSWGLGPKSWRDRLKWNVYSLAMERIHEGAPKLAAKWEAEGFFSISLNCWKPAAEHGGELRVVTLPVRQSNVKGSKLWRRCACFEVGVGNKEAWAGPDKKDFRGETPKLVIEQPPMW